MQVEISLLDSIDTAEVLRNSHSLVIARVANELVGLGNAISDGHFIVYFPHMLVLLEFHGRGVGRKMMQALLETYSNFHQLMLTADGSAIEFYKALGFERAGKTESMWIYAGTEH